MKNEESLKSRKKDKVSITDKVFGLAENQSKYFCDNSFSPLLHRLHNSSFKRFFILRSSFFILLFLHSSFFISTASAQYNVDRLVTSGRIALYYEDYVLSIQYFNQAIAMKPYLYEPWQLRAIAKFSLDDFQGAEKDASQAIELNPYITQLYDLRGIARIRQGNFADAISDYDKAVYIDPSNQNYWYNRAACHLEAKDYDKASEQLDSMIHHWQKYAAPYLLKAELSLQTKDTTKAGDWVKRCLDIDQFNAEAWRLRGSIALYKEQWKDADEAFSKVINLKPKTSRNYVSRAVARLKLNNMRGAMSDYNIALDIEPGNFLAHYNRGLLRQQVGDDNKAIEDFNYVLSLEPDNMMALFNRATLLDQTGDLRGAIRDYSKVIDEFPNFWTGLHYRAGCYRRLGLNAKAEQDEFRILKAQMDKHLGKQNRWSRKKLNEMRKKSEIDPNKYDQIVVEDPSNDNLEYKSEFRGKVQNRKTEQEFQPYICMSLFDYKNAMTSYHPFDKSLDKINAHLPKNLQLSISNLSQLTPEQIKQQFAAVDSYTTLSQNISNLEAAPALTLARSVAYSLGQNYEDALKDVDTYISTDSLLALAWWQRAVCNARMADFEEDNASQSATLRTMAVNGDFAVAERLDPDNAYILYCHGTFLAHRGEFDKAILYLTKAIELDGNLPEAFYNRGIIYLKKGDSQKAISDLGKAGELGIYSAYNLIKNNSKR